MLNCRTSLLLCTLLLAPSAGSAQQPDAARQARIDSVFAPWNRTDSPGCALGVYRDGDIAYARGYGMANLELGVPITSRTVFDIGSTSKQFTAASLVLLQQDGKLSLDDDVRRWIPELPDYGTPVTIRQMLQHTSGLRDYIGLLTLAGWTVDDVTGDAHALDMLTRQRALNFAPGTQHLYSNSGYFLASQIVERVADRSLRAFAAERIFAPLGMRHTLYRDDHTELVPHRATAYSPAEDGGYRIDVSNWEQLGDGAVFTTVEDLIRWDANFHDPVVGGPALLEELHRPARLANDSVLTYALGLNVGTYRGARTVSHGGSWGGYRAELVRFPEHRTSMAVLCNLGTTNPSALALRVADVVLDDRLAPAAAAEATPGRAAATAAPQRFDVPAAELGAYAGAYRSDELDAVFRVRVTSGGLAFDRRNGSPIEVTPRARDLFGDRGLTARFERDAAGRVTGFVLDLGRVRGLRFVREVQGS